MVLKMDVGEILKDFVSIKLSPAKRKFINDARLHFQKCGSVTPAVYDELYDMVRKYNRQLKELHASRDRAKRTLWKMKNKITSEQEAELVEQRKRRVAAEMADYGI